MKNSEQNIFDIAQVLIDCKMQFKRLAAREKEVGEEDESLKRDYEMQMDRLNVLEQAAMKCSVQNLPELVIKSRIAEAIGAGGFLGNKELEGTIEEWAVISMARSIEQLAGIPAPGKRCGYEGLLDGIPIGVNASSSISQAA
jgi:hypothetical protein